MLDHIFLLIVHQGRKAGKRRETVAMAASYDPKSLEVVVCSAWGNTEWIRDLHAHPALEIQIGRHAYVPEQRFHSEQESVAVVRDFQRTHPWRTRLFATILGWATWRVRARCGSSFAPARSSRSVPCLPSPEG